jgi:hypothetical protein
MENKSQQLAIVYEAFYDSPKTMKEVDILTGIMRENICRHCATLRQTDRIYPVGERECNITGHTAIIWTTDPSKIPPTTQYSIFT